MGVHGMGISGLLVSADDTVEIYSVIISHTTRYNKYNKSLRDLSALECCPTHFITHTYTISKSNMKQTLIKKKEIFR